MARLLRGMRGLPFMLELCYVCKMSVFERVKINCKVIKVEQADPGIEEGGLQAEGDAPQSRTLGVRIFHGCQGICSVQEQDSLSLRDWRLLARAVWTLASYRDDAGFHIFPPALEQLPRKIFT